MPLLVFLLTKIFNSDPELAVVSANSGLATSLAATHFSSYPLATIPGAIFSVWHNISGAIIANLYGRNADKQ